MTPVRGAATLAIFAFAVLLVACGGETAVPIEATAQSSTGAGGAAAPASTGATTGGATARTTPAASSPSKTAGKPAVFGDPCSVLTQAEVQAAVPGAQPGRNLGSGESNASCRWLGSSPVEPQVTFGFEWVEGAAGPLKASMDASLKAPGARRVDVGDGATIRADDRGIEIRFIKGEFNAGLSASPRGQLTEDAMIALAKAAAARIAR